MLDSSEISVVVQGPIVREKLIGSYDYTIDEVIESIRKVLPKAEIIISTWETESIINLLVDKVIQNADPGTVSYESGSHNGNRLIVSTLAGIKTSSRKYTVKMRSDMLLKSDKFIHFYEKMNIFSDGQYAISSSKILTSNYFVRNPRKYPCLFHCSDIFHFGRTDALLALWDVPLASWGYLIPEQYLFISALSKAGINFSFKKKFDHSISLFSISEQSLKDNFIIEDPEILGLVLPFHIKNQTPQKNCYKPKSFNKQIRCHTSILRVFLLFIGYMEMIIRISLSNVKEKIKSHLR